MQCRPGQPGRLPGEEAALLPRHAPTVYQDGHPTSTLREDEGAGQLEAVSGADRRDDGLRRHVAPYGISLVVVLTATPRALSRHLGDHRCCPRPGDRVPDGDPLYITQGDQL
jgi:hypothetical protein